jgi:hypothetical protein
MKVLIALVVLCAMATVAMADINYVRSYYRGDGTYVSGHYKDTSADGNPYNNRKAVWGY